MRKGFVWLFMLLIATGCVVTSEEFRYKQRFDEFYNILDDQERLLFADNDLDALGKSIDLREQEDDDFATNLLEVRIYEAITTSDGYETGYFFRYFILRELLRDQFYDYMDYFDGDAQEAFAREEGFIENHLGLMDQERKFRNLVQNLTTEYRLYDYTDEQIIKFFREVSFPEVSRKQVYYLLDFLKSYSDEKITLSGDEIRSEATGYLSEIQEKNAGKNELTLYGLFAMGYIDSAAEILESKLKDSTGYGIKKEFKKIKGLSGLDNLDTAKFLEVYYEVVLQEMDQEALRKTIKKF